jgi:hypothetical protein
LFTGDIFEKLGDEKGFSIGRKDGSLGLYQANLVEVVSR